MKIAEYRIGRTKVEIRDECITDPDEQKKILQRIGARRRGGKDEEICEGVPRSLRSADGVEMVFS